MRSAVIVIAVLIGVLLPSRPLGAQPPPPNLRWQTLDTENLRITFAPGLESLAQYAAVAGESAWARLATLTRPPKGRVDVLITDHVDFSNGFARTHPSNRVVLYAQPPVGERTLSWFDNWIDLVLSHELAHIFHLDATGGVGRLIRAVFGRVPMTWPAFPVRDTPGWSTEGLAVRVESDYTGYGRIHGSWHDMVVRTASLAGRFDPYERVVGGSPLWPGGNRIYIYGSLFLEDLERRYGEGTTARMVQKTTSALLPPFLLFGSVGQRTIGRSFGTAFREWREHVGVHYAALADSLRQARLTESSRITGHGRIALYPRISPDGTRLAYTADDGRTDNATRILALESGERLHTWRRNGTGTLAWLPDGSGVVLSQFEFDGPYRIWQDLWIVNEQGERRISRKARLQDPDVSRSGRIAAVENEGGTNRPVLVDPDGTTRALVDARDDVHWATPRWAPDGARMAWSRWVAGRYSIAVLDTTGTVQMDIADEGIAATPAWSPDGRYLVYSSDRTGIANLYAADLSNDRPVVKQITNVLTGAFMPDISPDGRTLVHSEYAADGYHIARIDFDPSTWRDPAPARLVHANENGGDGGANNGLSRPVAQLPVRSYSPWSTLLPRYWSPIYEDRGRAGDFFGFETSGEDLVGRNNWELRLLVEPDARWSGSLSWTSARFGVPLLQVQASRRFDDVGDAMLPDSSFRTVLEREDALGAFVILPIRRWRTSAQLTLGATWERESRGLLLAPGNIRLRDPDDDLVSVIGRAAWSSARSQDLSFSRENGLTVAVGGRIAREIDEVTDFPRDFEEVNGSLTAYQGLPFGGYARPVLAVRASALRRFGEGSTPVGIGGAHGIIEEILGYDLGEGAVFLPVRGFERGVRRGTQAWTATTELRLPIAIPGQRLPLTPFYFDRISLSLLGDVGGARCTGAEAAIFRSCARANAASSPLVSAGAELVTDIGIGSWFDARVRLGIAPAIQGPSGAGTRELLYLRFGSAF